MFWGQGSLSPPRVGARSTSLGGNLFPVDVAASRQLREAASLIETERLRLRRWKVEDRLPFAEMNADPEVMEFFPRVLSLIHI